MIQIKDNFLNKKDFKTIKEMMESNTFPWYFNNYKIDPSQKIKMQECMIINLCIIFF